MDSDAKLLISCVGENDELYTAEVLLLFKTIKKFGGNLAANAILVANFVKSIDPTIKQSLEDLGVKVTIVEPAEHSKETTSNKIRMLEIDDDYDYDALIALDCDTAVVRDFSSEINPQFFQAMQADMDLLTVPQWQKLFSYFGLQIPPERLNATRKTIITYFSSAVMSIPKQYIKQIRNTWDDYFFGLFEYCKSFEELAYHRYYFEELALSLAVEKEKISSKDFPVEMNFPTNYLVQRSFLPDNMSPFIVHYHHLYNIDGSITKTGYKMPDLAIEQVNKLILNSDTNHITKKFESKQIPISKDIKVLQKVCLGKQKLIEERERWLKLRDYWLKRAIEDVGVLQNINLGHQRSIGEKDKLIEQLDSQLKQAVKDVEILQNINLRHQKEIEEKDNQIMQLNELIKTIDSQLRQIRSTDHLNESTNQELEAKT